MFTINFRNEILQKLTEKQELALGSRFILKEIKKRDYDKNTIKKYTLFTIQLQSYY